ncbi:MAG: tetratricopeptide repeat protein [Georgfuchsia sp.]
MSFKTEIVSLAFVASLLASSVWAADPVDIDFVTQGDKQWAEGRIEDARKSFEQAIAANPGSIDAHMKLGGLQLSNSNNTAAIQTYQRAISLDRDSAKAWMGLGWAYLHSGQRELSKAAFDEAVRVDPSRKAQLAGLMDKIAK